MKGALYSIGYYLGLLFSLGWAFETWMDHFADPPVFNPKVDYQFWVHGLGAWLWFGAAIVLPALTVVALGFALHQLRRLLAKDGHVLA